jgi:flagellar biosynthetic protein FlhB
MAENQDGQEKTEGASPKKLDEARERGNVGKSTDVTTAAILLFGGLTVFLFGPPMIVKFQGFMKEIFMNSAHVKITEMSVPSLFNKFIISTAEMLLPLITVIFGIAIAGEVSQVGFKFASKKFTEGLNWKTIFNPFGGLKRMFFSKSSMFELIKSLAKIFILGLVVWSVLYNKDEKIIGLMERPFADMGIFMTAVALEMVWKLGLVYAFIALADFYFQRWRYKDDMKMTKKEVKDESKQSEGDPAVKSRIRSLMRGRIRKLMLQNVQKADVVITNPTHYAIALVYAQGQMTAPKVVAKGVDFLAARIREIAKENEIPIVEDPPLARTLYKLVEVDQEIPEDLFKAVAQILAYVYSLKGKI